MRMKVHTQIAMVHGRSPMVFVATEDIHGDPNLTIECLNRVLKREEQQRPNGLPDTLYLALDNCFRENKNTYIFAYLVWLIERTLFKEIFVSFLPVGHTHFDPDQFASRISVAVKDIDVTTIEQYVDIVRHCYGAQPVDVSVIEDVLDHRELFNPKLDNAFPKSTARCNLLRGVGTKSLPNAESSWFMTPSTPLHWWLRLDLDQNVIIQTRHTVDDNLWSNQSYMWNTQSPRPEERQVVGQSSGLLATDLQLAPSRVLKDTRRLELSRALDRIRKRMKPDEWKQLIDLLKRVATPRQRRACPDAIIQFNGDNISLDDKPDDEEDAIIPVRQTSMWPNLSSQNAARTIRRANGFTANNLVVGHFVAYTCSYTEDFEESQKQECWLGCVKELAKKDDENSNTVRIKRWHTNKLENISCPTGASPTYGPWAGNRKEPAEEWIDPERILFQFPKLTTQKRIAQNVRTRIQTALQLYKLNKAQPTDPYAVGSAVSRTDGSSSKRRRLDNHQ